MSDPDEARVDGSMEMSPMERLVRALAPGRVLTVTSSPPPSSEEHQWPCFDGPKFTFSIANDRIGPLPDDLLARAGALGNGAVLLNALVPPAVRRETSANVHRGDAAVILEALSALPSGTRAIFLTTAALLARSTAATFREDLLRNHGLSWIVQAGDLMPGVHSAVRLAVLVCEARSPSSDPVRLLELRGLHPEHWSDEIRAARGRSGGEVGRSIVVPRQQLGATSWMYDGFTKAHSAALSDTGKLGELRPLAELIESIQLGSPVHRSATFRRVEDELEPPDGFVGVIGGRNIQGGMIALPGRFWAETERLPEAALVRPGDVVLRALISNGAVGPKIVAAIVPDGLQAAFESHVIRLRWTPSVPVVARELIVSWLGSEQASAALAARQVGVHLLPAVLRSLMVPRPSDALLDALNELSGIERWYREHAERVRDVRRAIFGAVRYGDVVPLVLSSQRSEREQVRAAEDSKRFSYRVRNYYPHPIALRYERISMLPHGKDRIELVLECAEHLIHFLALCAVAQLRAVRPTDPIPSRHLASCLQKGAPRMTWGGSWGSFQEAVASSRRAGEMLELPFPGMSLASGPELEDAEKVLREQRNSQSHLHRMPDSELEALSRRLSEALDMMLRGVSFLTDVPLVFIKDYALDELSGERRAVLEFLRGVSVVFERRDEVVQGELARGSLGLVGRDGAYHGLGPWLVLRTCEVCKRPEVFVFNRFERGVVTYVAMESGHPWDSAAAVSAFERLLGGSE